MTQDCQRPVISRIQTVARVAAVFLCWGAAALADVVTITTPSDGIKLSGRVVGYDGRLLQLETSYGLMTLVYADTMCDGTACPDPENYIPLVRLSGAARMGRVMLPALIDAYGRSVGQSAVIRPIEDDLMTVDLVSEDEQITATFTLRLSSTDEGFADLIALETDIVMAMREVRPEEAVRANLVGLGDITDPKQARILGYDGLIPVTSPGLDLQVIGIDQLAQAFQGSISNWQELGGPDLPISLHLGPETGGPWQFFVDHVVRQQQGALTDSVTRHATAADLEDAIVGTVGGLAILPSGETGNTQPLSIGDRCGYTANAELTTLKTQDYALTQPLFLYLPDRHQPQIIQDFLAWLRGPEAQLVVRRSGFVDQGAVPIPLDAQGQRFVNAIAQAGADTSLEDLQEMVELLAPLTRLSTSFRFVEDSNVLDAVSRSNLLTLAQAVLDGRYDGQTIYFVGFGNGSEIDIARADSVVAALLQVLGEDPSTVELVTTDLGDVLPMGCADTHWGKHRNQRVELWVDQR